MTPWSVPVLLALKPCVSSCASTTLAPRSLRAPAPPKRGGEEHHDAVFEIEELRMPGAGHLFAFGRGVLEAGEHEAVVPVRVDEDAIPPKRILRRSASLKDRHQFTRDNHITVTGSAKTNEQAFEAAERAATFLNEDGWPTAFTRTGKLDGRRG